MKIITLKKKQDISNLFQQGIKVKNQYYTLFYRRTNKGFNRYLICVSKTVKKAVYRNTLKRKIRIIIPNFEEPLDSFDVIIVTDKRLLNLNFTQQIKFLKEIRNNFNENT